MQIVVCDSLRSFAESLAHILSNRGDGTVEVVEHPDEALAVVSGGNTELCIVVLAGAGRVGAAGTSALRRIASHCSLILLGEVAGPDLDATARDVGAHGVGGMRANLQHTLRLFDDVRHGRTPTVRRMPHRQVAPLTEAERLAALLSPREREVLQAMARGLNTASIARSLGIGVTTVRTHVQRILIKFDTHSQVAAVAKAVQAQLVSPQSGHWLIECG